ncbi:hypothetical protein GCM10010495_47510 [Kitasatospora herbaricolor]|uniref:hypothetical protein n=1 Tax=Kitasatospora herbaricolor TaxID=68217 RepID=UPI001749E410|nr:hypothetical protein [Kitasatospora herbaricolor]MDQ0307789.1 hypothetical protein [Kitasatospora herbaricolor]GGV26124.1 hypothetical protein GCM10010495_47510 [Kitasatospora herbaricolor]
MTGVDLVVAAVAAGTSAGLADAANSGVRDAYEALRAATRRRLGRRDERVEEAEPEMWEAVLAEELTAAGAQEDQELLQAAERLLALLRAPGNARTGGRGDVYNLDMPQAKGVAVGPNAQQTNTFN